MAYSVLPVLLLAGIVWSVVKAEYVVCAQLDMKRQLAAVAQWDTIRLLQLLLPAIHASTFTQNVFSALTAPTALSVPSDSLATFAARAQPGTLEPTVTPAFWDTTKRWMAIASPALMSVPIVTNAQAPLSAQPALMATMFLPAEFAPLATFSLLLHPSNVHHALQ